MIARTWRGWTYSKDGERYLKYLKESALAECRKTQGNRGAIVLSRYKDNRAEFLLVTIWESMQAIQWFAGSATERAVFYPKDRRFLVTHDDHADHFEVKHIAGFGFDQPGPDGAR